MNSYKIAIIISSIFLIMTFEKVRGQMDMDSSYQAWEDTSLGLEKRAFELGKHTTSIAVEDPRKAFLMYQRFQSFVEKCSNSTAFDTLRAEILKNVSFRYRNISTDTSVKLSYELLDLSRRRKFIKKQASAYRTLALAYEISGKSDSANKYHKTNLLFRKESRNTKILALGYDDYSTFMLNRGKYDSALVYIDSSLYHYRALNQKNKIAGVYTMKGIIFFHLGNVKETIRYYLLSEKLELELGNLQSIAMLNSNLGILYFRVGELDTASVYLNKAYQYYQEQNQLHTRGGLNTLEALASLESERGNYQKANKLFSEVLKKYTEMNNKQGISSSLMNRGLVYARMKNYDKAILDYEKAISIADSSQNIQNLKITLANLGDAYLDVGRLTDAITVSERVIEMHQVSPSLVEAMTAYITMYEAYKQKGDYGYALEMYENHIQLRDSIASEDTRKKLLEQKYAFDYEKKALKDSIEHEIELQEEQLRLEAKNSRSKFIAVFLGLLLLATVGYYWRLQTIRKKKFQIEKRNAIQKATIEKESEERARFARDLHDEVGSTLTMSLFNLEPLKKYFSDEPNQVKKLTNSISGIQSAMTEIRRISYDLMPKSLESGGLISATRELLEGIKTSRGIRVQIITPESINILSNAEEIQFYRIIQELTSNTIKHAQASQIKLVMKIEDQKLKLIYEDNGRGVDLESALNYSSRKGQGLIGIRERSELLEAQIHMESTPDNGFKFTLQKQIQP